MQKVCPVDETYSHQVIFTDLFFQPIADDIGLLLFAKLGKSSKGENAGIHFPAKGICVTIG